MQVNTLIIGAGRSGTTSLFKIMEEHPQVCFSKIKEVHYFSIEDLNSRGEAYYHSFFPHHRNEPVVASADTYLMMDYDAIKRIKAYNPHMKIIVMLRNPVDRAFSSYNYSVNYGYHDAYDSFLDSIEKEAHISAEPSIVKRNNLGHFYAGLYHKHLTEWLKDFPQNQFLLLTTHELQHNVQGLKDRLTHFLALNPFEDYSDGGEKHNPNAVPKFKAFEQFLLNRENPLRRFIRWVFPPFLKRLIIHSSVVDKMHNINRKTSAYEVLDPKSREIATNWFRKDMDALKKEFNIEL